MVFGQRFAQFSGNTLGQKNRHPAADAYYLDVLDLVQLAQEEIQQAGRQSQAVAAGEKHVAHLRGAAQVIKLHFKFGFTEGGGGVADNAAAGTVAAVAGALGGHQHQHPVGVAMHQPRHRAVPVFGQAVLHHAVKGSKLTAFGNDLLPHGTHRVVGVNQAGKVGSNIEPEFIFGRDTFDFLIG